MVKTVNDTASWMTFNCQMLKGPPFPTKPMRLAGTWQQYSNKAMPQLNRITRGRDNLENQDTLCSFRWLYHAKVMNTLEQSRSATLYKPLIYKLLIKNFDLDLKRCKNRKDMRTGISSREFNFWPHFYIRPRKLKYLIPDQNQ